MPLRSAGTLYFSIIIHVDRRYICCRYCARMPRCADAALRGCRVARMPRCADVALRGCRVARMPHCADAPRISRQSLVLLTSVA